MASVTCTISKQVVEDVKKCRLSNPSADMLAYIAKIDPQSKEVVKDGQFDEISFEDLSEELPEDTPRYVVLSYKRKHTDGRVSYPLVFIYYLPENSKPVSRMLYASTLQLFSKELHLSDPFMLTDYTELNQEWLESHLNKHSR
ncbi:hypothetical protein IWW50_006695 [Coemansia erecta]|nr:hypothetical protein GGF43_002554 [Coemansia sp. RSA 2618]KAJ2815844.1 hypothetical protein IWW50_006695 [Coemansia erecta]